MQTNPAVALFILVKRRCALGARALAGLRLALIFGAVLTFRAGAQVTNASTSTDWRDDEKNAVVVRELNKAYAQLPFSFSYNGVLDERPFELTWTTGRSTPLAWKGGVAGIIGDDVILTGGMWMPGRLNRAYAYSVKTGSYREIPAPPYETAYTQGAYDGQKLYVVGGRSAGRHVSALSRAGSGEWKWEALPSLPEQEGRGRWVAVSQVDPGHWLFLVSGHPTGTQSEVRDQPALACWRLALDKPGARWEPMAPYPGGPRAVHSAAVARGKLYVFGGSHPNPVMRAVFVHLVKSYGLFDTPFLGVPEYRDAYRYDPRTDRWDRLRDLPFGMSGGAGVVLQDRYILLMGSSGKRTHRVGKTDRAGLVQMSAKGEAAPHIDPEWTGYDDVILCYDIEKDNYARLGVMMYGVATCPWVTDGKRLYGFGGEPMHRYNENTENVLQIADIQ
jgi:hypothetical protein